MNLLNHQFILMYNQFAQDDDHITWLRQYNYEKEQLAQRHKNTKVNLADFGMEDMIGVNMS